MSTTTQTTNDSTPAVTSPAEFHHELADWHAAGAQEQPAGWVALLRDELRQNTAQAVSYWPGRLGRAIRARYFGRRLQALGPGSDFAVGIEIVAPERIRIGAQALFMRHCFLCAAHGGRITIGRSISVATNVVINAGAQGVISIGDGVAIGNNSVLRSSAHRVSDPSRPFKVQGHVPGTIVVEDDVWIAANCVLLPGTHLERGCVVGSGSVVSGVIKAYSIVAGNPARVVGRRGG